MFLFFFQLHYHDMLQLLQQLRTSFISGVPNNSSPRNNSYFSGAEICGITRYKELCLFWTVLSNYWCLSVWSAAQNNLSSSCSKYHNAPYLNEYDC